MLDTVNAGSLPQRGDNSTCPAVAWPGCRGLCSARSSCAKRVVPSLEQHVHGCAGANPAAAAANTLADEPVEPC